MPKGAKGPKAKGPKKRKLKKPLFSRFDMGLMDTEYHENFLKCDKDSHIVDGIPKEHFAKALRMCGVMPSERLVDTVGERIEKQEVVKTPPPSDDEWEDVKEEEKVVFTEEEAEILQAINSGVALGEIMKKQRSKKMAKKEEAAKREEEERQRLEEERLAEEKRKAEQALEEARRLAEEAKKKKKPKRELTWPVYKKKEEIKKLAKMKNRYKRFIKWEEFEKVMWAYAEEKQYTGQDILWAFRTLDPKLDYELEAVWPYGADDPLVPTDEIANDVIQLFVQGRQERFIDKEGKRFIKMADFKKEGFFDYKEMVEDFCKEANYVMGTPPKKKKLKVKET